MDKNNVCNRSIDSQLINLMAEHIKRSPGPTSRTPRHNSLRRENNRSNLGRPSTLEGKLYPLQWKQYLASNYKIEGVKVLAGLPDHTQTQIASMTWFYGELRRLHKRYRPDQKPLYAYHHEELDRIFGKGKFQTLNQRLQLFYVQKHYWNCGRGHARAYCLNDAVVKLKGEFTAVMRSNPIDLINQSGRLVKTMPSGILSRRADGNPNCLWKNVRFKAAVPIDFESIYELKHQAEAILTRIYNIEPSGELHHTLNLIGQHADLILTMANNKIQPGFFPMTYREYTSGRLYSGGVNLQNCMRVVRMAALNGATDVDIQNCHATLLEILHNQIRPGYPLIALQHYNSNPKLFQLQVASDLNISRDQVKEALIAILYGARLNSSPESALFKIFCSKEIVRQFLNHSECKKTIKDFEFARAALCTDAKNRASRGSVRNLANCWLNLAGKSDETITSHILQGAEALVLKQCIHYCAQLPHSFMLLQHDGFSIDQHVDVNSLSKHVMESLGLHLKFTNKNLNFKAELATLISETSIGQNIKQEQSAASWGVAHAR